MLVSRNFVVSKFSFAGLTFAGRSFAACTLFGYLLTALVNKPVDAAEPSHFRPSRSEPAFEIDRGEVEFELGLLSTVSRADGHELRSHSLPSELRMGFAEGWLVQVGIEGFTTRRETGGERVQGFGSSSVAVRHARPLSETVWGSILVGTTLATESSSLGGDRTAPYVQTAMTWYGNRLRLTGVTKYSRSENFHDFENGPQASVVSASIASFYDLDEQLGVAADFNFDHLRGQGIQRSFVAGFVWRANRRVLFDLGIGGGQGVLGTQRLFTAGTIIYF